jgi:hypothetical protein
VFVALLYTSKQVMSLKKSHPLDPPVAHLGDAEAEQGREKKQKLKKVVGQEVPSTMPHTHDSMVRNLDSSAPGTTDGNDQSQGNARQVVHRAGLGVDTIDDKGKEFAHEAVIGLGQQRAHQPSTGGGPAFERERRRNAWWSWATCFTGPA